MGVCDKLTMSNFRFNTNDTRRKYSNVNNHDITFDSTIKQSLEDYRRKIRFKQVKFSIIVLTWQAAILILSMLLLEYNGHIKPRANQVGAGAGAELEHMARITTF